MQYFTQVACPDELFIPTEDSDSFALYPEHRWIYNKLAICETQGIACGPHGVDPPSFPVFSKPIYNMRGMGIDSHVIGSRDDYERRSTPGHMWMELCTGEHVSTDIAVVGGEPQWSRHTTGESIGGGMFDYWTVHAEERPELDDYLAAWLRRWLRGFSGVVNFETIGGRIIEAHLRFADQWPDLYGAGWTDAIVRLYAKRRWSYDDHDRRTGYSVVLFGPHGPRYQPVGAELVAELLADPALSSVQITFHPDKAPELHAMPPGGFRLAIVNCWDLDKGRAARDRLALQFWSTQELGNRS